MTRLRLLGLLCEAELTVSELVAILGQSQPRVSRHLKLLVDAGLAERQREGAWAFFRLAEPRRRARARSHRPRRARRSDPAVRSRPAGSDARGAAQAGRRLFRRARRRLGSHPRACMRPRSGSRRRSSPWSATRRIHALLDLGTGTGRMLELIAPLADRAVGVDQSPAMLALARARIAAERAAQRAAAPGRHLRAAGRARRLRSRRRPSGAALPRRSRARAARGGAHAAARRPAAGRRFRRACARNTCANNSRIVGWAFPARRSPRSSAKPGSSTSRRASSRRRRAKPAS